ncbi:hypothetical protein Lalb_Chr01g0014901 [Lupinus albus]|uniref:Uncharacterized protein n=1 Tax=Lupinus albus TaxID=3870 RepID=A0A6A4R5V4_LUPAL|nr:hypothetical protein Lalb_Chr01g0014901 [Lupinus albus]
MKVLGAEWDSGCGTERMHQRLGFPSLDGRSILHASRHFVAEISNGVAVLRQDNPDCNVKALVSTSN